MTTNEQLMKPAKESKRSDVREVAEIIGASMANVGRPLEALASDGGYVLLRSDGRESAFFAQSMPEGIVPRIEWMHDKMRELLPPGWVPSKSMFKRVAEQAKP